MLFLWNRIKHAQLRDIWASQAAKGTVRVDVLTWLSKATLDIIGLAGKLSLSILRAKSDSRHTGFNYDFNSLASEKQSELGAAFATTFQAGQRMTVLRMLQTWSPAFRFIVRTSTRSEITKVLIRVTSGRNWTASWRTRKPL